MAVELRRDTVGIVYIHMPAGSMDDSSQEDGKDRGPRSNGAKHFSYDVVLAFTSITKSINTHSLCVLGVVSLIIMVNRYLDYTAYKSCQVRISNVKGVLIKNHYSLPIIKGDFFNEPSYTLHVKITSFLYPIYLPGRIDSLRQ